MSILESKRYAGLTTAEKIEKLWNDIAHVYAVDVDDEKDVERFQREQARYADKAGQPSWELKAFNEEYREYKKLKEVMA